MKQGHITPCWQGQQFYSLPYESAGGYGGDEYIKYGHDPYKIIINNDVYVGPKDIMPAFWEGVVDQLPDHEHYEVAIYRTPPANILPLHKDMYANFMKMHNITDVNKITRYIVFLEDCKLGHYFHVEDVCLCDWKKGDWISWTGSAPHAAYNMGIEHRFTMQITAFDR